MPMGLHSRGSGRRSRGLAWRAPSVCARAGLLGGSLLVGAATLGALWDVATSGGWMASANAHSTNSGSGSTSSGSGSSGGVSTGSGTSSTTSTTYKSDGGSTSGSGNSGSGSFSSGSSAGGRGSERTSDGEGLAKKEASELAKLLDDDEPQSKLKRDKSGIGTDQKSGGGASSQKSKPPETLEQLLKSKTGSPTAGQPAANQKTVKPLPVTPPNKLLPASAGRGIAPEQIGNQTHAPNEVLAVNLSDGGLHRARALGFEVKQQVSLLQFGLTLTQLLAPPGTDAAQAGAMLASKLPADQFALNSIYRIYKPANKSAARETQRTAPAARPGFAAPCRDDHCAGRELIGWKDSLANCSQNLRIGMIDTGVDHEHPAFASAKLNPKSFIPEGGTPAPTWHGTGVLALMAGDPHGGTPGLVPKADFYVAGIFFSDGAGDFATDTVSLLKALHWISESKVKLVNMSFSGPRDELVEREIARMSDKGVVFVAAAGNEGPTAPPSYPAAYKQVVAVTAVNKDRRNYPQANRGDHVDVAAPGVDVWTAVPGQKEGYYSGTSFAAPYVTSALASIYDGRAGTAKQDLLGRLEIADLGPPGHDPIYGRGLLTAPSACRGAPVPATAGVTPPNSWQTSVMGVGARSSSTIPAGFR